MFQLVPVYAKSDAADVVQRSRCNTAAFQARQTLRKMQSARSSEDHSLALTNADLLVPLLVKVSQLAAQCRMNVLDAKLEMVPGVRHRIFEVEHYSWRARVDHFHHQLGVVGWAGHLIALIRAPLGKRDRPCSRRRLRSRKLTGELARI